MADDTPKTAAVEHNADRQIHVAGYRIGACEVTQDQYLRIMGGNPSTYSAGNALVDGHETGRFPVESITWYDAIQFCNRLSEAEGLEPYYSIKRVERRGVSIARADVTILGGVGYRLPTGVEWEYACRAGTKTPFSFGTSCNGTEANCNGEKPYGTDETGPNLRRPTSVGSYQPNPWGLYDMHGNVAEWCSDGTFTGKNHRGGSFMYGAGHSQANACVESNPALPLKDLGFRVARSLTIR